MIKQLSCMALFVFLLGGCGTNEEPILDTESDSISKNRIPVADAGEDKNIKLDVTLVRLNALSSYDEDVNNTLTYEWSFYSKPADSNVYLSNPNSAMPTFEPDVIGTYTLHLKVSDSIDYSEVDILVITVTPMEVNAKPVARATENLDAITGESIRIDASLSSDADSNPLTYQWKIITIPGSSQISINNSTLRELDFTPDVEGTFVFELIVNDGFEDSLPLYITVQATTKNIIPFANPGIGGVTETGQLVALDATKSADIDGSIIKYTWSITLKPNNSMLSSLTNSSTATPSFTPDVDGDYVFKLIVTDDDNEESIAHQVGYTATTENIAPTSNAGDDQTVYTGTHVILDGSKSSDTVTASQDLEYEWSIISEASQGQTNFYDLSSATPSFTPTVAGDYVFQLYVRDESGLRSETFDRIIVYVSVENTRPIAQAGTGQSVYSHSYVYLDGSTSSDNEKDKLTYKWSFSSKPSNSSAVIVNATSKKPYFITDKSTADNAYIVQLIVNDGQANSEVSFVSISSSDGYDTNTAPWAETVLGYDVTIGSTITLDGSKSGDNENNVIYYEWENLLAPNDSYVSRFTTVKPSFTPQYSGEYVFSLLVKDDNTEFGDRSSVDANGNLYGDYTDDATIYIGFSLIQDHSEFIVKNISTNDLWYKNIHERNMHWPEASSFCNNLVIEGKNNWTLPTEAQAKTLRYAYARKGYGTNYLNPIFNRTKDTLDSFWLIENSGGFGSVLDINYYDAGAMEMPKSDTYSVACVTH